MFLNMKTKEKKALLARLIELSVHLGEDITGLIAKPLSYFDWEKVKSVVEAKQIEYDNH